ncbi:alpha/beta hydrolase [Streptomyces sp. SID3212]|uniref:alpha/beta fold hydrolase n=1 Tax=unclassified Streptomyces TaxID=2593676 RepID=UPI00136E8150|nr:alpha/beta hydrolase [Streptomyces sp. SID3212]MYV51088.1 alpha/beta fold hydrolase [Streptomyces sp. SID3212]
MSDETRPQRFGALAADSYGAPDQAPDHRPPLVLLHGLGYDRHQWDPTVRALAATDPGRRVLSFDLPGHGDSPRRDSYRSDEIAAVVHEAVTDAGLDAPVVVGHSLGGVLATVYAATYPARGAVNVDQPLLPGNFAEVLRRAEPVLRSPAYGEVWDTMLAGMHIELLPPAAQELARSATPAQDLMLGYWNELLVTPAKDLDDGITRALGAIRDAGIPYHYVSGEPPPPAYRHWLESVLPDVTVTVLAGSGHFPHLSRPAELAAILAAFR